MGLLQLAPASTVDYFDLYMRYVGADTSEPPIIFHRWTSISIIAAMLGRQVWFPFGHSAIYPNQFIQLMGSPGTRKSTAINAGVRLLKKTGYSRFASDRTSKERFLMDMRQYDDEMAAEDLEVLTLNEPSESFIAADEFTDFIGQNNVDFVTMLTKLWDNPEEYKHPKIHGKSVEVFQPTVNILCGNTPQNFAVAFPPESLGNGFLSRMIFVHGEATGKKVTFPSAPDALLSETLLLHLKTIKNECRGEMSVSAAGMELCHRIYREYIEIDDIRFKHYSTRRFTHLLKLATVIACTRLSMEISSEDLLKANTILHYTEKKMPRALGEFGKSKYSEVTSQVLDILNHSTKPLDLKKLWKHVARELTKIQELGDIMKNLQLANKVQLVKVGLDVGFLPVQTAVEEWAPELLIEDFLTEEEVN